MSYYVTAYSDFDEGDVYASDSFDSYSDAMEFAGEKADELVDELGGSGVDQLAGAPDFEAEMSIEGTTGAVVIRDGTLM